jgi:hypothetical protein
MFLYTGVTGYSRAQYLRGLRHAMPPSAPNTWNVGSNPTRGWNVSLAFILYLYCPVYVAAMEGLILRPRFLPTAYTIKELK